MSTLHRLVAIAALGTLPMAASANPDAMVHQGRLIDSQGDPLGGSHILDVGLYVGPNDTSADWTERFQVTVMDGYYAVTLGARPDNPIPSSLLDQDLFVGVTVDVVNEMARSRVAWAPRAVLAREVSGGPVNATTVAVNDTTVIDASGVVVSGLEWDNVEGKPAGFADGTDDTLTPAEVVAAVEASPVDLADGSSVDGGLTVDGTLQVLDSQGAVVFEAGEGVAAAGPSTPIAFSGYCTLSNSGFGAHSRRRTRFGPSLLATGTERCSTEARWIRCSSLSTSAHCRSTALRSLATRTRSYAWA